MTATTTSSNESNFINLANFWAGKFFDRPVLIKKDNRMNCPCAIQQNEEGYYLAYNSKILNHKKPFYLPGFVFHELGHILIEGKYITKEDQIDEERRVEEFSLMLHRYYYPDDYNNMVKHVRRYKSISKLKNISEIHYLAFKDIKEYKGA